MLGPEHVGEYDGMCFCVLTFLLFAVAWFYALCLYLVCRLLLSK